ncbi:carboxypeptidase-like regulatory domain-containing protein [Aerosakkonema sp. BLCC-F183]|uniref:carboxypeptidase-like regulatory domain-containing protein n=1 Tax=Aerosakkonema sp. BLCC-F183 TaxID=3342834 RepID=UPI0035B728A4
MSAKEQTKNRLAIAGQVIDADTKLAIPGVLVKISQMPDKFKNWLDLHALQYGKNWEKMQQRPDRTLTGIDGYFYFINLPDGDYELTVYKTNYKHLKEIKLNLGVPNTTLDFVLMPQPKS